MGARAGGRVEPFRVIEMENALGCSAEHVDRRKLTAVRLLGMVVAVVADAAGRQQPEVVPATQPRKRPEFANRRFGHGRETDPLGDVRRAAVEDRVPR